MIYKTLKGEEYAPIHRAVVCINKDNSYSLFLRNKIVIKYKDRKEFEATLESGKNKFFCRICRNYDFLTSMFGGKE